MSEAMQFNEARESSGLLDAEGRAMSQPRKRPAPDMATQVETYIREEPMKAALIILGIGYVIGRLRLIV